MKTRQWFRSISTYGMTLIALLVFIPTETIAQDYFYYSGNQKHFFDKAGHWVSVMVPEEQRSSFLDQVTNNEEIKVRHTLDEERGIYWLESPKGGDVTSILDQVNRVPDNISTFPVFYRIAPNVPGDTIWFINTDEFRVTFEDHVTEEEINQLNELYSAEVARISQYGRYTLRITENSPYNTLETANRYHEHPITRWALPSHRTKWWSESIQDPYFGDQWYLQNTGQSGAVSGVDINAVEAWELTTGSSDIIVAVIDDGVEGHDDFYSGQVITGFTAGIPSGSGEPEFNHHAHGQAVAGIIAANHNSTGVRGVAPEVKIMPVNAFHNPGITDTEDMAAVIDSAWENGADVLNISVGGPDDIDIEDAIRRALINGRGGKGAIVVKSAGNTGLQGNDVTFPGTVDGVFVVGAVNSNDEKLAVSPANPLIDLVAPSGDREDPNILDIVTTNRMGTNGYQDGIDDQVVSQNGNYLFSFDRTSAAAPQAAGVAALLLSINPDLEARSTGSNPNPEIQNILRNTATSYGSTSWAGHGRLNAADAVNYTEILAGGAGKLGHSGTFHFRESFTVPSSAELTILADTDVAFYPFVNLNIESGAKLIIEEGATFTMDEQSEIYIEGDVTMSGSSNNKIVFENASGITGTWDGITIKGNGTAGSFIEHTNIDEAGGGLRVENTFGIDIESVEITNSGQNGLYLNQVASTRIINSVFKDNTWAGAVVTGSNGIWFGYDSELGNEFRDNGYFGLDVYSNNTIRFGDYMTPANGIFKGNGDGGIYTSDSYLYLGEVDDFDDVDGGFICFDETPVDIRAKDSQVYAESIYWGDGFSWDYPTITDDGGNTISYIPVLFSPPSHCAPSLKVVSKMNASTDAEQSGKTSHPSNTNEEPSAFHQLLLDVSPYRQDGDRSRSLAWLADVINGDDPKLAQKARILRMEDQLFLGNHAEAVNESGLLLEQEISESDEAYVNYLLVKVHLSGPEINETEALAAYQRVVELEPREQVHSRLKARLERHDIEVVEPIARKEDGEDEESKPERLSLSNYPNPFNPVTLISYTLPDDSQIKLEVFDITGRRVAVLVDRNMPAGIHQAAFDAAGLSSGVYLYRLQAGSRVVTETMLLLQ